MMLIRDESPEGLSIEVRMVNNYLFITYIVTSKPKRISVAAGFVHIVFLLRNILFIYGLSILGKYIAIYDQTTILFVSLCMSLTITCSLHTLLLQTQNAFQLLEV